MNKKLWSTSTNLQGMLDFVKGWTTDRKLRLFAVACARRFDHLFAPDEVSRQALEVAERFADGTATEKERGLTYTAVRALLRTGADEGLRPVRVLALSALHRHAGTAANETVIFAAHAAGEVARATARSHSASEPEANAAVRCAIEAERAFHFAALRAHFHYPPRAAARNPPWLTSDVLLLARGIYEEKAFDRMPILADALQDAGWTDDEVLNRLRHSTGHARGCWVLDAILGKE